jgi:hypothetical protein
MHKETAKDPKDFNAFGKRYELESAAHAWLDRIIKILVSMILRYSDK